MPRTLGDHFAISIEERRKPFLNKMKKQHFILTLFLSLFILQLEGCSKGRPLTNETGASGNYGDSNPTINTTPATGTTTQVDTTAPMTPRFFIGNTGISLGGDTDLSIGLPSDVSDYYLLEVRRLPGTIPPTCTTGVIILQLTNFTAGNTVNYTDNTGNSAGGLYSYRICILDKAHNLFDQVSISGVSAKDTTNPDQLVSFTGATGVNTGEVILDLQYPANFLSEYQSLEIRRTLGTNPPSPICNDGTVVLATLNNFQIRYVDFTGTQNGESFSYRACVRDRSNNLASSSISGVRAKDRGPVSPLASFSAVSGLNQGEVALNFVPPSDYSNYANLELRRTLGTVPPASDCSDGAVIKTYTLFSSNMIFVDQTGQGGSLFSYRACIRNSMGTLTSSNTVSGVRAKEILNPLVSFSAMTGNSAGEIIVSMSLPDSRSNYQRIEVRRIVGSSAPASDCTDGTVVQTLTAFPPTYYITDTGQGGEMYSYRACIFSMSGQLVSSNIALGAIARCKSVQITTATSSSTSYTVGCDGTITHVSSDDDLATIVTRGSVRQMVYVCNDIEEMNIPSGYQTCHDPASHEPFTCSMDNVLLGKSSTMTNEKCPSMDNIVIAVKKGDVITFYRDNGSMTGSNYVQFTPSP